MGYIKVREVNKSNKIYWVVSKREGKKGGGSGKVKKIEYYLGDSFYSLKYLSWYVWNNDIKLDIFLHKLAQFKLKKRFYHDDLECSLDKDYKVILTKKEQNNIDLREKEFKDIKESINESIKWALNNVDRIPNTVKEIIEDFKRFNESINVAKKINKKTNIDDFIHWESNANIWFNWAMKDLEYIKDYIPRTQVNQAKEKIWKYCLTKCPLEQLEL